MGSVHSCVTLDVSGSWRHLALSLEQASTLSSVSFRGPGKLDRIITYVSGEGCGKGCNYNYVESGPNPQRAKINLHSPGLGAGLQHLSSIRLSVHGGPTST